MIYYMHMNQYQSQSGFGLLRFVLGVVILIVFISLLGYNIEQDVVQNEAVQSNFAYTVNWLSGVWSNHLASPILYVWNDIFIDLLWQPFVQSFLSGDWMQEIPNPGIIVE